MALDTRINALKSDFQPNHIVSSYRMRSRYLWADAKSIAPDSRDWMDYYCSKHDGEILSDLEYENLHAELDGRIIKSLNEQLEDEEALMN